MDSLCLEYKSPLDCLSRSFYAPEHAGCQPCTTSDIAPHREVDYDRSCMGRRNPRDVGYRATWRTSMPGLRFSQSTDLAIHGLWALARLETGRFILLSDIAGRQNVSESYLSKVFQRLTRAGLTRAMRGKRGGYTLARPPAAITVGDVVRAMDPEPPMYQCLAQERCCEAIENCLLLRVFAEAEQHMYAVLNRVTLADLLSDFLRGKERMGWLQLEVAASDAPAAPPVPPVAL